LYVSKIPDDYDFHDIWTPGIPRVPLPLYIAPKGTMGTIPELISAEKIMQMLQGGPQLFIYGWAKYHDVFDGTKEHITRYCYQLMLRQGQNELNYIPASCSRNNCIDDECKVQ
jgi:hypothetical protein